MINWNIVRHVRADANDCYAVMSGEAGAAGVKGRPGAEVVITHVCQYDYQCFAPGTKSVRCIRRERHG